MDYLKFKVLTDASLSEILLAFFSEMPFDTFEENEAGFDAYIPRDAFTEEVATFIKGLKSRFDFNFEKELLPSQNWNQIWESNFHPVVVEDFCGIRADFHPPLQQVQHELVINPKMAFGTGHHETTNLVIQMMQSMNFSGVGVLDFGCGTGILAILASKLGAHSIDAVDIEQESFNNTIDNCKINGVTNVRAICGELVDVPEWAYDIILANINRNVILDSLPSLCQRMKPGGVLVVSGFVYEDEAIMQDALTKHGFATLEIKQKNNWLAIKALKQS